MRIGHMKQSTILPVTLPSPSEKKFENRLIFGEVMGTVWCLVF